MELLNSIQKQYIAMLTNDFQSHNDLCKALKIDYPEAFLNTLKKKYAVDEWNESGDHGNPDFKVRLAPVENHMPTNIIHFNGSNSGPIVQSSKDFAINNNPQPKNIIPIDIIKALGWILATGGAIATIYAVFFK